MRGVRSLGSGLLCLAAGAVLLYEPLSHPVFSKFSLFVVSQRPSAGLEEQTTASPKLRAISGFLRPDATWAEVVSESGGVFEAPKASGFALEPFSDVAELVEAVRAGGGICNNWTEALIILCREAGRACREWAHIPYPDVSDSGHSVVDVWLPDQRRWAMLDAYLGFWAQSPDARPLSAPEFERAMLAGEAGVEMKSLGNRALRIGDIDLYYRHANSRLVEIVRNEPAGLAGHWTRRLERLSKPLGQIVQGALGIGPLYLVPRDEHHRELCRHMDRFRLELLAGSAMSALGVVLLARCAATVFRSVR